MKTYGESHASADFTESPPTFGYDPKSCLDMMGRQTSVRVVSRNSTF